MSIKKRNILSIIMVLCIVIGSMMPCFAWVNRANLTTSDPWEFSDGIASSKIAFILKGKTISYNEGDSAHSVYFIHATYDNANDSKSSYGKDTLTLVAPGKHVTSDVYSSTFDKKKYFRLLLNPYGTRTTGCEARGAQSNTH